MTDDKVIYMVQKSKARSEDLETVESALREAQSQYLQLIDELPAGYTEFDLKGNLVSFNQATLDMSFRTKDELTKRALIRRRACASGHHRHAGIGKGVAGSIQIPEAHRKKQANAGDL
jgi:PAS domain-containing protein